MVDRRHRASSREDVSTALWCQRPRKQLIPCVTLFAGRVVRTVGNRDAASGSHFSETRWCAQCTRPTLLVPAFFWFTHCTVRPGRSTNISILSRRGSVDGLPTRPLHRQPSVARDSCKVSERLGEGSVIKLLRGASVPIRNQGLTNDQIAEAAQLYTSGQSLGAIAAHLGVDPTTVHRHQRRCGVRMRDTYGREC